MITSRGLSLPLLQVGNPIFGMWQHLSKGYKREVLFVLGYVTLF